MSAVTIIGAGLAGLSASLTLAKENISVNLISAQPSERAQSVLAEGGINAALDVMGEHDSVGEHFSDTMRGGCDLADPAAVRGLTEAAPGIVRELAAYGVPFSMQGDRIIQRNFGGQKKKRTAFAKSSTGKALMTAMIDAVRKYEGTLVTRYTHHVIEDLVLAAPSNTETSGAVTEQDLPARPDQAAGKLAAVLVRDVFTGELLSFDAPVILAFGGPGGLFYGHTTGTTANDAEGLGLIFARGVELANLEFIQYHPTTFAVAGKRLLVSEAARGEGGRLFADRKGSRWYFMEEKYPELGNLMPRDVVSREMEAVSREDGVTGIYLDLTVLSKEVWKKKLPDLREEIIHYLGIDPAKEPVPVSPGIHYFMGGIRVDRSHKTSMEDLYAAGECACQYHGANRLGANSMLGALYGGKVAAETVLMEMRVKAASGVDRAADDGGNTAEVPRKYVDAEPDVCRLYFTEKVTAILAEGLGIRRNEKDMREALVKLGSLRGEARNAAEERRILLAEAVVMSALARKESRGAHTRTDYPDRSDADFRKTTVADYGNGTIRIRFKEI